MATLPELEAALKNADAAGDMDAARKLAAVVARARQDVTNTVPGAEVEETVIRARAPTIGERLSGVGEAALALGTGATGGAAGMVGGTVKGLSQALMDGSFGTQDAADMIERAAMEGAESLTFQPRSAAGQEYTQSIGEILAMGTPLAGNLGEVAQLAAGVRAGAPAMRAAAQPAIDVARRGGQAAGEAAQRAAAGAAGAVGLRGTEAGGAAPSAGAAGTPVAMQRAEVASQLPVPFKGKSGLTSGQASRDFAQLQFEKETAKAGDLGAPLRERAQNQTATLIQNFDALVDRLEPVSTTKRELGTGVDQALVNRFNLERKKVTKLYQEAREAGQMKAPIELTPLATAMDDLQRFEGVSPNISAIRKEAQRLKAIDIDDAGNITPGKVPIDDAELLRQFVNESTDWMDKRQATFAKRVTSAIDEATENQGGELYRKARKARAQVANEFENVGLTSKLLNTKRGTDDRIIALEDVFDKVIVSSKVDEMNKLRGTLLKAGDAGKQAWADLKAAGIERIKNASMSASQMDAAGNPLISPDKMARVIRDMDATGKLESLYGKKQAQTLRDLSEIASVIYTAPPGAINTSNTASALMVALDSLGTFAVTGVPAPVATALKEASKLIKDRKTKARINEALNFGLRE